MTTAMLNRTGPLRDLYRRYLAIERDRGGIGPDGCFWCGGRHSSDCCPIHNDPAEFLAEDDTLVAVSMNRA